MKYNDEITKYKNAAVTKLHALQKRINCLYLSKWKNCLACKTQDSHFFLQKAVTECIIVNTQASRPEQFTVYDMFSILLNEVTNVLDINLNSYC